MELATRLGLRNPAEFAPLWVVDFPLLELDEAEDGTMHHPFTSKTRGHGFGYESW
jgi:aspartyl-tRNA synthetase